MDFDLLIQRKRERFEQLEREIADPTLFENRNRAGEIMREHANVKALLAKWNELSSARMQLADNRELANSTDADLAQMAQEEIPALENRGAGAHSYQHRHGRGFAGGGGNRSRIKT